MKTITLNVCKFSELSDSAKQRAIEDFRSVEAQADPFGRERCDTLQAFQKLLGLTVDFDQYGNYSIKYNSSWTEERLNLKGFRAVSFFWNNIGGDVFRGKYYSKYVPKNGNDYYNIHRRSKQFMVSDWPLTGVCYDGDILGPIIDFMTLKFPRKWIFSFTVEDIINKCVHAFIKACESEDEQHLSDKSIIELIEDNDWEFLEDGRIYGASLQKLEVA
jgi:hypothetical protein